MYKYRLALVTGADLGAVLQKFKTRAGWRLHRVVQGCVGLKLQGEVTRAKKRARIDRLRGSLQ